MKLMKQTAIGMLAAGTVLGTVGMVSLAEELPEISFCLIQMDPYPSDEGVQQVEEAINAITEEKIGVHVNIECFDMTEYQTNVVLRHASSEPCDLFAESVPDAVAAGRAADITDIMYENAPEAIEAIGEDVLSTCIIDGRCYGFPYNKEVSIGTQWLYRKDLVEGAGIEIGELTSYSDLTAILEKLHETYPDIYPIYLMGNNHVPFILSMKEYGLDCLSETNTFNVSGACLLGEESQESLEVVNLYETDQFKTLIETTREWYLNGYISPDAVATSEGNDAAMKSGRFASCITNGNLDLGSTISNSSGYEIGVTTIGNYTLDTINSNAVSWVVSSQCKEPEAALRFLNLTYTDPEILNLIVWGIEGVDYELLENGQVRYPEGLNASSVPYTCSAASGYVGSQWMCYEFEGSPNVKEELLDIVKDSKTSNALGFNVDLSAVSNEISATVSVVDEYMPGLITGTLDLEENYDKFIDALYNAGLQTIIDEKQLQLDEWAQKNGK